ncbi:MAG: AAA family ATPase [Rickettsiales bacterium]|nr:AAA family ATPase [Rickettsiales bacterium]
MPKFNERNAVLSDGVWLPKTLFYFDNSKQKSVSPASSFNPASALDGEGFQASTSPSKALLKKALVFDQKSLASCKNYGDKIALLKRLQIAGFEIFFCTSGESGGPNKIHKLASDLENISQLRNLAEFDQERDFVELAKQGASRDKSLLLDEEQASLVLQSFEQRSYAGSVFGNDLRCGSFAVTEDEIRSQMSAYFRGTSRETFAFYLSRVDAPLRARFIEEFREKIKAQWARTEREEAESFANRYRPGSGEMYREAVTKNALDELNETISFYGLDGEIPEELRKSAEKNLEKSYFRRETSTLKDIVSAERFFPDLLHKLCAKKGSAHFEQLRLLIQNFPERREKFLKLTRDLSAPAAELQKWSAEDIAFQKIVIDLFEGRIDQVLEQVRNFKISDVTQAAILIRMADDEGVLSRELLTAIRENLRDLKRNLLQHDIDILRKSAEAKAAERPFWGLATDPRTFVKIDSFLEITEFKPSQIAEAIIAPKQDFNSIREIRDQIQFDASKENEELLKSKIRDLGNLETPLAYIFLNKRSRETLNIASQSQALQKKGGLQKPRLTEEEVHAIDPSLTAAQTKPTYADFLNADLANVEKIAAAAESGAFSELAVMRLPSQVTADQCRRFLPLFKDRAPLKHLVLPAKSKKENQETESVVREIFGEAVSFEFFDYENYLGIADAIEREDLFLAERKRKMDAERAEPDARYEAMRRFNRVAETKRKVDARRAERDARDEATRRFNRGKEGAPVKYTSGSDDLMELLLLKQAKESPQTDQSQQPPSRTNPNEIRLAQGESASTISVENSKADQTFQMALAGEILNNPGLPQAQIRTAIIKTEIATSLEQHEYTAQKFSKLEHFESLPQSKIEDFKKSGSAKIYYKFSQQLFADSTFRLPSASASEEFVGVLGDKSGITIKRGDDDFYYVTSTRDREFTYVVAAPHPDLDLASYKSLSGPIRQIIDEYRNPKKGFRELASPEKEDVKYDAADHQGSMRRMFEERSGVCRHRVVAVEFKLLESGLDPKDFRITSINNNHVVLEIKNGSKWIKVDLGGGAGTEVNLSKDEKYAGSAVVTQPEPDRKVAAQLEPDAGAASSKQEDLSNLLDQIKSLQPAEELQQPLPSGLQTDLSKIQEEVKALERARQAAKKALEDRFLSISKLEEISNPETLKEKIVSSDKSKILVVTSNAENHANFFLSEATAKGRPTFYIDGPSKIDLHRTNLLIAGGEQPILSAEGLLSDFLKRAAENPDPRPLLVINWNAFSTKQKAALNTAIDESRRINGELIDDSIQILSLSSSASQDWSFRSRHDLALESKAELPHPRVENLDEKTAIDLQGFPNWRRNLFGKVVLVGEEMVWQKSEFVLALEAGKSNFDIVNLSPQAARELRAEFKKAQAVGKFIYHGHEIILPENAQISCDDNTFKFDKFSEAGRVLILENVTFAQSPPDTEIINTQIFDFVICGKEIAEGKYFERDGLIKRAADSESPILNLFISSKLSDGQWYCLFNEAQKHSVILNLALAPQVKVPAGVAFSSPEVPFEKEETFVGSTQVTAQIFVSNDCDKTLVEITQDPYEKDGSESISEDPIKPFAVVDVEDFNYQDLIERIDFETTPSGFKNFKKTESEFLARLKEGKKIVLKGEFSTDLLQMLEPILVTEAGKNLILIVEDKACRTGTAPKSMQWLAPKDYEVRSFEISQKSSPATELVFSEIVDTSHDLADSKTKSDQFIADRKKNFSKTLASQNMLRLIGHSGVGKSRLLCEFEENDKETTSVYRDLKDFAGWANDKSGKRKILFIDESNIEDRHFTMFSPLKNGGEQRLFYQGKFFDLGENHKVVFACNPVEYGGGRFEQKLFEDGEIPAIYLRDFPASYIYEKILKEAIYDQLGEETKSQLPESVFKEASQKLIEEYQAANSKKKSSEANDETVRELQEKTLRFIEAATTASEIAEIKTANFISTNATKEVEEALNLSLSIRQKQRNGELPNHACGLNGVILEGDSGVGKSVLIEAVFASKGVTEIKLGEEDFGEKQRYYKIDANLPLDKKREIIVKAFEQGNIVWIDEINSCIDDGLEKILNAALTGEHPDGNEDKDKIARAHKPGFTLVSSVNSAGLEGRSLISPALLHRTTQPRVKNLREYSVEDLTKIVTHWLGEELDPSIAQNIAKDFKECLHAKNGSHLNLRMLKKNLAEILPAYVELTQSLAGINQEKLSASLKSILEKVAEEDAKRSEIRAAQDKIAAEERARRVAEEKAKMDAEKELALKEPQVVTTTKEVTNDQLLPPPTTNTKPQHSEVRTFDPPAVANNPELESVREKLTDTQSSSDSDFEEEIAVRAARRNRPKNAAPTAKTTKSEPAPEARTVEASASRGPVLRNPFKRKAKVTYAKIHPELDAETPSTSPEPKNLISRLSSWIGKGK